MILKLYSPYTHMGTLSPFVAITSYSLVIGMRTKSVGKGVMWSVAPIQEFKHPKTKDQ